MISNLKLRNGDIILKHGDGSAVSWLIREIGGSEYSHCFIHLNNYLYEMEPKQGMRKTFIENCDEIVTKNFAVLEFHRPLSDGEVTAMTEWWENGIATKTRYGFLLFVNLLIVQPMAKISKWIYKLTGREIEPLVSLIFKKSNVCSTSIDNSYKSVGIDLLPGGEGWTVPSAFLTSDRLNRVH